MMERRVVEVQDEWTTVWGREGEGLVVATSTKEDIGPLEKSRFASHHGVQILIVNGIRSPTRLFFRCESWRDGFWLDKKDSMKNFESKLNYALKSTISPLSLSFGHLSMRNFTFQRWSNIKMLFLFFVFLSLKNEIDVWQSVDENEPRHFFQRSKKSIAERHTTHFQAINANQQLKFRSHYTFIWSLRMKISRRGSSETRAVSHDLSNSWSTCRVRQCVW